MSGGVDNALSALAQQRMRKHAAEITTAIARMRQLTLGAGGAEILLGGAVLTLPRLVFDEETMSLTCPDCGADDSVCAVDWTYGKHRMSTFSVQDGRVMFTDDGCDLGDTVAYICGQCSTYVALPVDWKEEWA